MAFEIPTKEPTSLIAGDSWKWDKTLDDFPPGDGWQLSYALRGPDDLSIDWSTHVSANGGTFEVRVAASETDVVPGLARLYGFVTDGTDRHTVYDDRVRVYANPASAVDSESHDEKVLAALDAMIEGRATKDHREQDIGGTQVALLSPEELVRWQNVYRARVLARSNPDALTPQYEATFGAPA